MVTLGNPADSAVLQRQRHLRQTSGGYDEEINLAFSNDFKRLAEGESDDWYNDSDGALAIIIMF